MDFWTAIDSICNKARAKGLSEVQAQMISESAKYIGSADIEDLYKEVSICGAQMNEAAELFTEKAHDAEIWDEYRKAEGDNEALCAFLEKYGESEDEVADFLYDLIEEDEE